MMGVLVMFMAPGFIMLEAAWFDDPVQSRIMDLLRIKESAR